MLNGFLKDASLALCQIFKGDFSRKNSIEIVLLHHFGLGISNRKLSLNGFVKDASFGPPLNLHTCNSFVEFLSVGK